MSSITIRVVLSAYLIVSLCLFFPPPITAALLHGGGKKGDGGGAPMPLPVAGKHGTMVAKDERRGLVSTEFGEISGVKVSDGRDGFYDLQFITMEPNSLFVPAYLHSDMVFFVSSGSGTLSWVDLEKDSYKLRQVELRTGDVYRLRTGSFFYLQSNLDSDRRKFRINAIFSDSKEEIREGSSFGAYSTVGDLLLGFDDKILQAALNVDEETIQELKSGGQQPMIVHGVSKGEQVFEVHYRTMRAFLGLTENGVIELNKNKNKAYNILEAKHDFENCNGWSLIVTSKQMDALKDSDFGVFMVNLTKGAMMGPHWNPMTAEIAVVLSGRGMVHVVCPSSTADEAECKNSRFRVEEGDVFVVPRYHPMAQMSFNNGSFAFFGFTTTQKKNHPQYLVGSASVFQVLDKRVLAASLGVSNMTMDEILSSQKESVILECTSCAEEEERLMEEEIERQKEEEEREREEEEEERRKEEEEREREEEEEREREEEEEREREEEEKARRQEEEARREQEEARKREEEARREEAKRRQEEEEEARREQEKQEAARRQREEAAARRQEEEAARRRQEEEAAAREQEEADTRRRQEEEAAAREQEEEADRRRHEEEAAARHHEEEAARRRQHEEGDRQRQHEEGDRQRQHEEAARQREEEAARRRQKHEGGRPQDEAARRRQQEQEAARQQEEAMRRKEEEAPRWGGRGGRSSRRRGHQEEAGGGGMTEINFIY